MRHLGFFLFTSLTLLAQNEALLSTPKKALQEYKRQEIEQGYDALKYNWVNPLNVVISYQQSTLATDGSSAQTQNAALTLQQDIFRSGGIDASINYAEHKKSYDLMQLEQENATLTQSIITTILYIKRTQTQIKQSELRVKNREIEIFLKRQQYEAGAVDVTLLNNAIMERNRELQTLLNLQTSLAHYQSDLYKLSDKKVEEINLPTFTLVEKAAFVADNYNVAIAQDFYKTTLDQYEITRSGYFPKLTLLGQYSLIDYSNDDQAVAYNGDANYIGLQLSMPLDFNRASSVEKAKVTTLKNRILTDDKRRDAEALYAKAQRSIENYKNFIALIRKNLTLYDALIDVTQKGVKAGYKAGYDLQTLQNTKAIDDLEISVNELNIQLEAAQLYFLTKKAENAN